MLPCRPCIERYPPRAPSPVHSAAHTSASSRRSHPAPPPVAPTAPPPVAPTAPPPRRPLQHPYAGAPSSASSGAPWGPVCRRPLGLDAGAPPGPVAGAAGASASHTSSSLQRATPRNWDDGAGAPPQPRPPHHRGRRGAVRQGAGHRPRRPPPGVPPPQPPARQRARPPRSTDIVKSGTLRQVRMVAIREHRFPFLVKVNN
ncbi:hypothetical protein SEVIR_8G119420v4 [Setaria viridis]|uniref:Uncharacterized protein n=1 Tax=Setaria viridis TaxID=4556 RepID=A0A4V6D2Z8_SETVI|nr:hypothetical protein SEVIR_8G119420v2 [Setaria viridis]